MTKFALAVCLSLLLLACGSSPENLIVGRWEVEGAPMKMTAEFHKDGTASLTMFGQTLRGAYKFSGDELEWSLNGTTTQMTAHVTGTELEVTNQQNQTIKYRRR